MPRRRPSSVKNSNLGIHSSPSVKRARDAGDFVGEILGEKTGLGAGKGHFQSPAYSKPPPTEEPEWFEFSSSRVARGYYDRSTKVIAVDFVDGTPWHYADVNGEIWKRFKRSKSPGRFVGRVLDGFPYGQGHH